MAVQDLAFDGILGGTEEGFDVQVLFDPFEEKLYLPAAVIQIGNGFAGLAKLLVRKLKVLPVWASWYLMRRSGCG